MPEAKEKIGSHTADDPARPGPRCRLGTAVRILQSGAERKGRIPGPTPAVRLSQKAVGYRKPPVNRAVRAEIFRGTAACRPSMLS